MDARGTLGRAGLAAAGATAPLATVAALLTSPAWIVLAVASWGALLAVAVRAPRLAVAWGAALIAFVFGLFGHYAIAVDHSLCGGSAGATALSAAAAAVVYLVGGVWALRTPTRALWAWPSVVLLGLGVHLLLLFALPGTHGPCET